MKVQIKDPHIGERPLHPVVRAPYGIILNRTRDDDGQILLLADEGPYWVIYGSNYFERELVCLSDPKSTWEDIKDMYYYQDDVVGLGLEFTKD